MGGIQRRKRVHNNDSKMRRKLRLKRRTKDLDQIDDDLKPGVVENLLSRPVDFDKPGMAQFYCVHCAKDFINGDAFKAHIRGKPHKIRVKNLRLEPYTIEESLRAAGMGSYKAPAKRKMDTLLPEAVVKGETIADVKRRALGLEDVPLVEGEEKVEAIKDDDIPDNQEEGVDDNSDSEDEEGDKRM